MTIVFIATQSPFREYILSAARKSYDTLLIYEKKKDFKVNYPIDYLSDRISSMVSNKFAVEHIDKPLLTVENINNKVLYSTIEKLDCVD